MTNGGISSEPSFNSPFEITMKKTILCACLNFLLNPPAWSRPIVVGSVHHEVASEVQKFLPLADYLGKQLSSLGVDRGKVLIAPSIEAMAKHLKEGKVDIYLDSPFPAFLASERAGGKLVLRRWKKGLAEYHSVVFVRKGNGINRPEDLKGKTVAFEAPYSSSGYFLPKFYLTKEGHKMSPKENADAPVSPGEIGYLFSNDDENTMVWVLRKRIAAGAMDNQNFVKLAKGSLNQLKIIYETPPLPRQVVAIRGDLPKNLEAEIVNVLENMHKTEAGRQALLDFEKTAKFDKIPEGSLKILREAKDFLNAEFK